MWFIHSPRFLCRPVFDKSDRQRKHFLFCTGSRHFCFFFPATAAYVKMPTNDWSSLPVYLAAHLLVQLLGWLGQKTCTLTPPTVAHKSIWKQLHSLADQVWGIRSLLWLFHAPACSEHSLKFIFCQNAFLLIWNAERQKEWTQDFSGAKLLAPLNAWNDTITLLDDGATTGNQISDQSGPEYKPLTFRFVDD